MLKSGARQLSALIRWVDIALAAGVFLAVLALPAMSPAAGAEAAAPWKLLALGLVACLGWPLALDRLGLYQSQRRSLLLGVLGRFLLAGFLPTAAMAAAAALLGLPLHPAFAWVCGAAQTAVLAAQRIAILAGLRLLRRRGRNYRNALIVGTGPRALAALGHIARHPEWGTRVIGFLDDAGAPVAPELPPELIHKLDDFPRILQREVVDEVIVACPRSMLAAIMPVVSLCATTGVPLTLLPDLFGDFLPPPRVSRFGALTALSFAPVHHDRFRLAVKRIVDVVGAGLLLVAAAPLIAVAAALIRATSPGPVFFRAARCGRFGRPFQMLKLRTMCHDAEALQEELLSRNEMDGPVFKVRDDPRVTRVGRLLRRFSIDELPQLWNVLRGEMSLVGPRPPIPGEVSRYDFSHRRRLSMRPGITCIWQVSGRNLIPFEDWVKLDLEYIDGWSLTLDLVLLLKTAPAVLLGRGAS
jgi:exopolysaccharide biosynthesis polyprenyl glycosylphosphotransferase